MTEHREHIDFAQHMGAVAARLLGQPNRKEGDHKQIWRYGRKNGSLEINVEKGTWTEWDPQATGTTKGGVLDLIAWKTGLVNGAAAEWLRTEILGESLADGFDPRVFWRDGKPISNTLAARYLSGERKIDPKTVTPDIARFHPEHRASGKPGTKAFPAIVFPALDANGKLTGIQAVRLTQQAKKLQFSAKISGGSIKGAALRAPGDRSRGIVLVEGPEDMLTVWQASGRESWATTSVSLLGDAPLPPGCAVTVCVDRGSEEGARLQAEKLARRGHAVRLAMPPEDCKDANEALKKFGAASVVAMLDNAEALELEAEPEKSDGLLLSLDDWLSAEIAPPDFIMGEVFHTESRAYLVGPTGLGKTNFSMALAAAMAAGTDFLHWKASGKCRKVLYVDGEMGKRLMRQRIQDVVRRHGGKPGGLSVLCRANAGDMPPLNTKEGQQFIEGIIERLGGVDFIVFDNLQALVTGSLREEDAFGSVLNWAKTLTSRSIGQIWVHHTGIDESRGYGDKSKEWQFDTVLLLKRAGEDGEVLFDLEFTKARERTPDNRADFAAMRVALDGDAWTVAGTQKTAKAKAPSPKAQAFHGALTDALCVSQETGVTTKEAWRAECHRKGLMHLDPGSANTRYTKSSQAQFNQYVTELVAAKWIGVNGEAVRNTRKALQL